MPVVDDTDAPDAPPAPPAPPSPVADDPVAPDAPGPVELVEAPSGEGYDDTVPVAPIAPDAAAPTVITAPRQEDDGVVTAVFTNGAATLVVGYDVGDLAAVRLEDGTDVDEFTAEAVAGIDGVAELTVSHGRLSGDVVLVLHAE